MTIQTELTKKVVGYLEPEAVEQMFTRMGSRLNSDLTEGEYQACVQVITWFVLEELNRTKFDDPNIQINEAAIISIVDNKIQSYRKFVPQDPTHKVGSPSPYILSRLIWCSLKLTGATLIKQDK